MSDWRSLFAALSPRMRRLTRWALALMAGQLLAIVARAAEWLLGSGAQVWVPTTVLMFALAPAGIGVSLHMRSVRLAEQAGRDREALRRAEFQRLRAPRPDPGQCPVCAYDDLDALAERDRDLEVEGTPLARVVGYGPDRAHAECAEAVPHVPPRKHHHQGFYVAGKWTYCCEEMREPPSSTTRCGTR